MKIDLNKSCLGWVMENQLKNERGDEMEFNDHLFLLEPFSNWHWKQCCMKSAQVGFSTLAIIKSLYALSHRGYNVIYTLPTVDDVRDFVPSKVDSLITQNPVLASLLGKSDAIQKKQLGVNFIWYRGTHGKKAAIMHTSDLNIYDEYDASNLEVIDLYASRLQKSIYKGEWMFANPIRPGGIDVQYEKSDKRVWMINCSRCNHWQNLDYFKNVDKERQIYVCSRCKKELSNEDRRVGEWVKTYEGREIHGYHINQLMAAWVTAKELIYLEENKTPQYFYNMILGLPYVEKDDTVDRSIIENAIIVKNNSKLRNALGVDVGYKALHYVLGNHEGIYKVGILSGEHMWKDLEMLMNKFNPICVIDANPDPYPRRKLIPKYKNKMFACFYKHNVDKNSLIQWGDQKGGKLGHVYTDRNQAISDIMYNLIDKKIRFTIEGKSPQVYLDTELDEYIKNWENLYRITAEDRYGIPFTEWKTSGPDHFVHATVYFKMALSRVQRAEDGAYKPFGAAITILDDKIPADKIPVLGESYSGDEWKYI